MEKNSVEEETVQSHNKFLRFLLKSPKTGEDTKTCWEDTAVSLKWLHASYFPWNWHGLYLQSYRLCNMIFLKINSWGLSLTTSDGTLLWIYRRLIGRSYIALARQDQYIGNIHSEVSDLDYFGICWSVAICNSYALWECLCVVEHESELCKSTCQTHLHQLGCDEL